MPTYHYPEDLGPEQDERDAAISGRRFFVYVLETEVGHYVGHTARLKARLLEHEAGEVKSTAGTRPRLAWNSGPMRTRDDAARFEAALKSWRDSGASRFEQTTGLRPIEFFSVEPGLERTLHRRDQIVDDNQAKSGLGRQLKPTTVVGWFMFVGATVGAIFGLLWAFNFDDVALRIGMLKVVVLTAAFAPGVVIVVSSGLLRRWPNFLNRLRTVIRRPFLTGAILGSAFGLFWSFGFTFGALGMAILKVVGLAVASALGIWLVVAFSSAYTSSARHPVRGRQPRRRRRRHRWR